MIFIKIIYFWTKFCNLKAEKRVLECKLQETVKDFERSTTMMEEQYVSTISLHGNFSIIIFFIQLVAINELRAFLNLEVWLLIKFNTVYSSVIEFLCHKKSERVNLQVKLEEQSRTISQLTHHLKLLQSRSNTIQQQ